MKVKKLIELLSALNPELEVVLSKDGEGNEFSPLDESYSTGQYVPDSTWSGEFRSSQYSVADGGCRRKDINAIVLWPVN